LFIRRLRRLRRSLFIPFAIGKAGRGFLKGNIFLGDSPLAIRAAEVLFSVQPVGDVGAPGGCPCSLAALGKRGAGGGFLARICKMAMASSQGTYTDTGIAG